MEQISVKQFSPGSEDSILYYHCVGYLDWIEDEWRSPKDLIKRTLTGIPKSKRTEWVARFAEELLMSYISVLEILNAGEQESDYLELSELLAINRTASFWPLLIKIWPKDTTPDKRDFKKCCRLCEIFGFKGYAIAGIRADTGTSKIRTWTNEFGGNFEQLFQNLYSLSLSWDIPQRFITNIQSPYLYNFNKADVRYFTGNMKILFGVKRVSTNHCCRRNPYFKGYEEKFNIEHIEAHSSDP